MNITLKNITLKSIALTAFTLATMTLAGTAEPADPRPTTTPAERAQRSATTVTESLPMPAPGEASARPGLVTQEPVPPVKLDLPAHSDRPHGQSRSHQERGSGREKPILEIQDF